MAIGVSLPQLHMLNENSVLYCKGEVSAQTE